VRQPGDQHGDAAFQQSLHDRDKLQLEELPFVDGDHLGVTRPR